MERGNTNKGGVGGNLGISGTDGVERLKELYGDPGFVEQLAVDIVEYLMRYWSVGDLRLTMDVLNKYIIINPTKTTDLHMRFIQPILRELERRGLVEVEDHVINWRGERRHG